MPKQLSKENSSMHPFSRGSPSQGERCATPWTGHQTFAGQRDRQPFRPTANLDVPVNSDRKLAHSERTDTSTQKDLSQLI